MAGRHGNKGIVANIVRARRHAFLGRWNTSRYRFESTRGAFSYEPWVKFMRQFLVGLVRKLGVKFATPIFDGAHPSEEIDDWTEKAGVPTSGKTYLYDGGTGERFDQTATVGVIYMLEIIAYG